jgi:hypothetical protein
MEGAMSVSHDPLTSQPFPPDPIPNIFTGGGLSLVAGSPGAGKTALVTIWCKAWLEGEEIFGHQVPQLPVYYLSIDRSWTQSSAKWFTLAGIPDIAHYSLQDDLSFQPFRLRRREHRLAILEECLDKYTLPWGTVVIVDPISIFLGGDLNNYDACACACMEIRRLCVLRGITLVGMVHAGKQKGKAEERYVRLQDRLAGSVAQLGFSDTVCYLGTPEEMDEEYSVFYWQSHHAPAQTFRLQRNLQNGLLEPQTGFREQILLPLVPVAPESASFKEIVAQASEEPYKLSRKTVYRYLMDLVATKVIAKVGHGRYTRPQIH